MPADDLRDQLAAALMAAFDTTAIVCDHTQVVQFAPLADAALAVLADHANSHASSHDGEHGARHPLEALADVNCQHTRRHAMCLPCAAMAVRPEILRHLAELERLRVELETERALADEHASTIDQLRGELDATELNRDMARAGAEGLRRELKAALQRADQAEDLLRIAHDTSNKSEAERARAVQRAEEAEAERDAARQQITEYRDAQANLLAEREDAIRRAVAAQAERDALKAAIERVRALHSPEDRGGGPECTGCRTHVTFTPYEKCKTIAALDGPETATQTLAPGSWLDQLAAGSLEAARAKFGPEFGADSPASGPTDDHPTTQPHPQPHDAQEPAE